MNKCVLCRRCIRTCALYQGVNALASEGRGDHSGISTFMDREMMEAWCINCGQCVNRCPTGALTERDDTPDDLARDRGSRQDRGDPNGSRAARRHRRKLRLEPGTPMTFQMNTALKRCGFDRVFDTNFSADLTILEEGAELISRLYKAVVLKDNRVALPQFTSCSPGWIKFIEHFYPAYLAESFFRQKPAADDGRDRQDLFRREERLGSVENRQRLPDALHREEVRGGAAGDEFQRPSRRRLRADHARNRQDVQTGRDRSAQPRKIAVRRSVRHPDGFGRSSSPPPAA